MKYLLLFLSSVTLAASTGITFEHYGLASDDSFSNWFTSYIEQFEHERSLQKEHGPQTKEEPLVPGKGMVRVPILVYHGIRDTTIWESPIVKKYNVSPAELERQFAYLKNNGFHAISLLDLADYFEKQKPLPEKPVIITFDDGWEDQYTNAFPLLKRYGLTATFFIFTNAINKAHFMTLEQIRDLAATSMTIGAHTKSHPYLNKIPKELLLEEIGKSKKILEDDLGVKVDVFAYPFGQYNSDVLDAVHVAGFRIARSTHKGVLHGKNDLYTLKSREVTNDFARFLTIINP